MVLPLPPAAVARYQAHAFCGDTAMEYTPVYNRNMHSHNARATRALTIAIYLQNQLPSVRACKMSHLCERVHGTRARVNSMKCRRIAETPETYNIYTLLMDKVSAQEDDDDDDGDGKGYGYNVHIESTQCLQSRRFMRTHTV